MNLNEQRDIAYRIACEHGWHDKEYSDQHWLMLIVTEISEAVEADRKNQHPDYQTFKEKMELLDETRAFPTMFERYIKDTVEDELADVVIRCLDLAGLRQIQLPKQRTRNQGLKNKFSCSDSFPVWAYKATWMVTRDYFLVVDRDYIQGILFFVYARAEYMGIDLEWHIEQKMKYNKLRPYKHGKNY